MTSPLDLAKRTLDVGIVAHDPPAMLDFYGGVLGLEPGPVIPVAGGEVRVHQVGASTVKVWCLDDPPPAEPGGIDAAVGYRLLTLLLPDLEAVLARAEAAGIEVERRAFGAGDTAVPLAFLDDVDGNALELVGLPRIEPALQVGLTVADVDRTTAFLTDDLGLPANPVTTFDDIESHSVMLGDTMVKYWQRGDGLPVRTGPIPGHAGIRYVTVHVGSVTAAVAEIEARGGAIAMAPIETGDATIAFVADPDGNWLELLER